MELTRNAGRKVLPLIERAEEEVTVCSPFISPEYAKTLVEKSEDGADVTVLTARPGEDYHRRSLRILREGPEPSGTWRGAGVALIFLGALAIHFPAVESVQKITFPPHRVPVAAKRVIICSFRTHFFQGRPELQGARSGRRTEPDDNNASPGFELFVFFFIFRRTVRFSNSFLQNHSIAISFGFNLVRY